MSETKPNPMFAGLVLSLQSSAWIHLGKVASPMTGKVERNLEAAKETIDLLGMLEEKTQGNLVDEEETLLRDLLMNLRLNYVEEARRGDEPTGAESSEQAASDDGAGAAPDVAEEPRAAGEPTADDSTTSTEKSD